MIELGLLGDAIVSGLLLRGFYAAVTVGVSISFGMLDIVNIAHPALASWAPTSPSWPTRSSAATRSWRASST